jgi:hypothetical protein
MTQLIRAAFTIALGVPSIFSVGCDGTSIDLRHNSSESTSPRVDVASTSNPRWSFRGDALWLVHNERKGSLRPKSDIETSIPPLGNDDRSVILSPRALRPDSAKLIKIRNYSAGSGANFWSRSLGGVNS